MTNMRAVTSQASLRIVRALSRGPLRFNEIERAIGAPNPPFLSKTLKKLTRDGIVVRNVEQLGPPAVVRYTLTPVGRDLAEPASALIEWAEQHAPQIAAAREYHKASAQAA